MALQGVPRSPEMDKTQTAKPQGMLDGVIAFPQAASRFQAQNSGVQDAQLLHTVLDNMAQGVLLFDADARLVFCNRRYLTMYDLPEKVATPGRSLRELLMHRAELGKFSEDLDDYIDKLRTCLAEGKTFCNVVDSGEQRVVSVVNTPVAGGGWLATHEDVTDRQRAQEQIAHMARHDA